MALGPTTSPIAEEQEEFYDEREVSPTLLHARSMESDVIRQIREASLSPTPISQFLADPDVAHILSRPKKSRRASTNSLRDRAASPKNHDSYHRSERDRSRSKDRDDTSSIINLVLAEEQKSSHRLKTMLRTTTDRLEHEMRRADQAEARAQAAEKRVITTQAKVSISEASRIQAEADASHTKEEMKRVQMLLEATQRDVKRAEEANRRLEEKKRELEKAADKAQESARKYQRLLSEAESNNAEKDASRHVVVSKGYNDGRKHGYEEGYEEGFMAGKDEGYDEGHVAGFQQGRFEGYEEGRSVGKEEGFEDGLEEGRKEERSQVLRAMNTVMNESDERSSVRYERTQEWLRDTSAISDDHERESQRGNHRPSAAVPRPIWLHRRLHTDPVASSRA
ncbi:hypothetical protein NEOLEDRAFT_446939 [Neolentinus lepideus HHB14362 ss-1]|uniref:Essential protein Yae1 N-terminal domain-containing protein n=1 Tax=Neolentinus lepideus HHB14362 ss-1 TaxID=1314782 RepID=A0A165RSJ8_9AGAM|nr:hypothetical protein NEOLEDRAFT_446939 [Neolentinus lepideus HHB14362 ss-1]